MKAHQAEYPIATQCRVLGVSTSGYYAWLKRVPSARSKANAELLEEIKKSHKKSDGTYGAPRIHADLPKEMGASLNRVARVMCDVGIQGVTRRKWTKTTVRDEDERAAPDLVDRDFTATGPDQLWVADITHIPTWAGFLYLAVVMDVSSRRIVGWAMATHLRTELVLDALNMALRQRRPEAVVHHLNLGSTRLSRSGGAANRRAYGRRWARWATATTMPCPSHFSRRSSVSSSTAIGSRPRPRRGWRFSGSSRAGTTRGGGTPPWATSHR